MKPVLYTFRRCPYAMRARMAISYAGIDVDQREIALKNKPQAMLAVSSKGTVPVLILADETVIDESLDIMLWALQQNDPDGWLDCILPSVLIKENDGTFKQWLDQYKYADRYPQQPAVFYREQGELFLQQLEMALTQHHHLAGNHPSLIDYAIFPFIRQFALVDNDWFDQAHYPRLRQWLDTYLDSNLFSTIMIKYPLYHE